MAAAESLSRLVHHLRRRCGDGPTDGDLLARFAQHRDEQAFAELVSRHGRVVLGVARRHLPDRQTAEDVVQATFAALARQASRLGRPPSLVNWLYTVALRQARTARIRFARQHSLLIRLPHPTAARDPLAEVSGRELLTIIDDELARLPAVNRLPLLLCAVEGLSRDEAAVRLGWTLGSLRGRLERGRELLRRRLTARGLTVPAALAGGLLATPAEALPAALVQTVVRAAVAMPATNGMLRMTIALLIGGGLCIGAGAAFWSGGSGWHGPATPPAAAIPTPQPQKVTGIVDPNDPTFAGHFSGRVICPDGNPVSGARVFIAPAKDPPGKLAVRAKTDAGGRFEFDAPDMTYTEFDGLPARRGFVLSATADGYGPDWIGSWSHGRDKASELTLQLAKDDVPIHGQFLDPDGRPLAGATVLLTGISIPLERNLEAQLDRLRNTNPLTEVGYDNSIFLRPLSSLIPVSAETRTDAGGRFTLSGLGRDRLVGLSVSAASVLNTYLTVMTRDASNVAVRPPGRKTTYVIYGAGFTLKLERGRTISGVVRDRDSHEPIAGMLVGIGAQNFLPTRTKDENYPRDGVLSNQTVTDAKGRFNITGLNRLPAKQTVTAASAPGMLYESAAVDSEGDSPVAIECQRGIPFRLKVLDELGRPVEAEVTYNDVLPNPYAPRPFCIPCNSPFSKAARNADGTYRGFLGPGPGAVLVTTPSRPDYRPAYVDPKAFFAPGRTDLNPREWGYGTQDRVETSNGSIDQNDYAAIVLVNPAPGSGPLELSATVERDRPRRVSLIDSDGKPVVGAEAVFHTGYKTQLRAASFPLTKLHPDRERRIWFLKDDRRIIGFLAARGDGDTPYTVRMQPWGTVTGRLVDEHGKPMTMSLMFDDGPVVTSDPEGSNFNDPKLEENGQFRIEKLVPGLSYSCVKVYRRIGHLTGAVFDKVVLRPGEVRDLGDVRVKPSGAETPGAKSGN